MTEYVIYAETTREDGSVFDKDLDRVGTLSVAREIMRDYRKIADPNERVGIIANYKHGPKIMEQPAHLSFGYWRDRAECASKDNPARKRFLKMAAAARIRS